MFYKNVGRFPQQNTKYAEHYTSYGYSSRIYGNFAEILMLWFIRNPKKQGVVYNWLEYNF